MKAYGKDILRSIAKGRRRFFAIMLITVLGVTMFSGLRAACGDLRLSADRFYDAQDLHDIEVMSTLGMTDKDISALASLDGVKDCQGVFELDTDLSDGKGGKVSIAIKSLSRSGIDRPYLTRGRMPKKNSEAVVTSRFLSDTGLSVGDSFTVVEKKKEKSSSSKDEIDLSEEGVKLKNKEFLITGCAVDICSINNSQDSMTYRDMNTENDTAFVWAEAFDSSVYTSALMTLDGAGELFCYSDDYKSKILRFEDLIAENVMEKREKERTQEVVDQASDKIEDAQKKADRKLGKAKTKLEDAQSKMESELKSSKDDLDAAKRKLDSGSASLTKGEADLKKAQAKADKKFADARKKLKKAKKTLDKNEAALKEGRKKLKEGKKKVDASQKELDEKKKKAMESLGGAGTLPDAQITQMQKKFEQAQGQIDKAYAQIKEKEKKLDEAAKKLAKGRRQYEANKKKVDAEEKKARAKLKAAKKEIEKNRAKLKSARAKYESGKKEYESGAEKGHSEIESAWDKYYDKEKEAKKKIADAREKLKDIETADWYIQDRISLGGYSNVRSDADSIEGIAAAFPVVFFIVAVLMSLTTVTRLVEEDRSLIGTYKALGFTDREIRRKYEIYALLSAGLGCLIGTAGAFIVLPSIIFRIFHIMYLIPDYYLSFAPLYGLLGPCLFMGGIFLAAVLACRGELRETPAVLMRPRAPKAGMRVLLEYITPVWRRLSFLNKVTARNIFRYKKRLFMTIAGIAGCMALLMFGFSIRDSVNDLTPRQYEETYRYDVMAAALPDDGKKLFSYFKGNRDIKDFMKLQISSASIKGSDNVLSIQLMVVPDEADLEKYIGLKNLKGKKLSLADGRVYVTRNAGSLMNFQGGDTIKVQLADLKLAKLKVTDMAENFLGNNIYMSRSTFEKYFEKYEENAVLANFSENVKDHEAWGKALAKKDAVQTSVTTAELTNSFSKSTALINMVVYIVIIMSACLAFVVLFTLSTTNISERERELATIKVLGFYDREVHLYINKETLILTLLGIVCGLPLGAAFARMLAVMLTLPDIYLASSLHPVSYALSAGLSFLFALLVNVIMDRTLDQIDPVEALKSVE